VTQPPEFNYEHEITPEAFRRARLALGWGCGLMGRALRLGRWWDDADMGPKARVKAMESGRKLISGPVAVAVAAFSSGFRPDHIKWDEDNHDDN
jgi:hypothetical protein